MQASYEYKDLETFCGCIEYNPHCCFGRVEDILRAWWSLAVDANMNQISCIQRPVQILEHELLNDLLWSDPSDGSPDWSENDRDVSVCLGTKTLYEFLARFDLDLVCRAHMVQA